MPRFFDDYSNTYLTHDSAAGRKQQRRGWKFRENFKLYYQKNLDEWRSGPMGLASAQQDYLRNSPPGDPNVPPLPEGWKEETDEATRINFYVHEESGKRTWVRPEFFPPPAGMAMRGPPPGYPGNRPPPPQRYPSGPPPNYPPGPPPNYPPGPPPPMNPHVPPPFPGGAPGGGGPPPPNTSVPPSFPNQPPPGVPPPNLPPPPRPT